VFVQPTQNRKANLKTKKKDGVQMVMKFRNHKDPLYYDAQANDRIFVPFHVVRIYLNTIFYVCRKKT